MRLKDRLGLRGTAIDVTSGLMVKANGFAGGLRIGNLDLEVRPKCLMRSDTSAWRAALIEMMRIAGRWKGRIQEPTAISGGRVWFGDLAALSYAQALERGLAFGPLTDYVRRQDEGPFLRGTLRVREQVNLLWSRPWQVAFEADDLTTDNSFSRLLAFAGRRLRRSTRAPFVSQRLDTALAALGADSTVAPAGSSFSRALPPQHAEYSEAVEMARLLLRHEAPGEGRLPFQTPGLVVNTEVLFQEYVSGLLRRAVAATDPPLHTARQRRTYMEASVSKHSLFVIPDDRCIDESDRTQLVVDAKYRVVGRADPRPNPSEWHQVLAGVVATGATSGLLVYPAALPEERGHLGIWRVDLGGRQVSIGTTSVDVASCSAPLRLCASIEHLGAIVQRLAG